MNYCFNIRPATDEEYDQLVKLLNGNAVPYSITKEFDSEDEKLWRKKSAKSRYFMMKRYWSKVRKAKLNNGDDK